MSLLDGIFGGPRRVSYSNTNEDQYMRLNIGHWDDDADADASPASIYVRIASISDIKDSPLIKEEIYNGNIVIADISKLKLDRIMFDRVVKDLRAVSKDVNGDIVGLGDQKYLIITPNGVKIFREKIGGSR